MCIVAIDAGHSLYTSAVVEGINEWELNNSVANIIISQLKDIGIEVIRTDDISGKIDVSLFERRNTALKNKCILLISIHHNCFKNELNEDVTGVEVYYHSNNTHKDSKKLAEIVARKLSDSTKLVNRGVKNARFSVINTDEIPALLSEGGFMDSIIDRKIITSEEGKIAYAHAISDSIIEFLGGN